MCVYWYNSGSRFSGELTVTKTPSLFVLEYVETEVLHVSTNTVCLFLIMKVAVLEVFKDIVLVKRACYSCLYSNGCVGVSLYTLVAV